MNWLIRFIFPRRLHWVAFLLRLIVADVMPAFIYFTNSDTHSESFFLLDIILVIYTLIFIILPRIRDVGISGWWLLVAFIPFANSLLALILLFRAPRYQSGKPLKTSNLNSITVPWHKTVHCNPHRNIVFLSELILFEFMKRRHHPSSRQDETNL